MYGENEKYYVEKVIENRIKELEYEIKNSSYSTELQGLELNCLISFLVKFKENN